MTYSDILGENVVVAFGLETYAFLSYIVMYLKNCMFNHMLSREVFQSQGPELGEELEGHFGVER